jgi:hypothetical protein
VKSILVASQERAKKRGGVISASVWTVEITPPKLRPETTQYVDSSSANRLS